MIKEIVEFIKLFPKDLIFSHKEITKGLYILIDDKNFEIIDFKYYDKDNENDKFWKKYDITQREHYCKYINSNKNFDNKPIEGKNQIHSASPYAIFFRYDSKEGILKRLIDIRDRIKVTGYYEKIKILTKNKEILKDNEKIEKFVKEKLIKKDFIKKIGKNNLKKLKNKDYVYIFFNSDLQKVQSFYDEYSPKMIFNSKGLFEEKDSYTTKDEYICPIYNELQKLGASEFLNNFASKKPFYMHKTRDKAYGGYSALYSGKVVKNLSMFEELLKTKKLPNPLPIFISQKDMVDNEYNRVTINLFKNSKETLKYKELVKEAYEKVSSMSNIANEINDLNFYLIFWKNTNDGLKFFDVDYIDNFKYYIENFKIENIFELPNFNRKIENIFDLEYNFFSKFFYTLKNEKAKVEEKNYLLQNNYFAEKININRGEELPLVVATKFYQYSNAIFDYIYKSKQEALNSFMYDDICLSILKEQIKSNSDWKETYYIRDKLNTYISLYKNFNKGEDLATVIPELRKKIEELLQEDSHIDNDREFAFTSGQLIWFILNQNESASKTHSLLDIFISKHTLEEFKKVIAINIQKYSHAFKFFQKKSYFEKLASEVLGYELESKTIKELIPLIMSGYFSKNVIQEKINKKSEEKKKSSNKEENNGQSN